MKRKRIIEDGFTLAEVLVTLAVVGVLAVMTIPGLVQSKNEQELKTAWINDYSIIDQATRTMAAANGGSMKGLAYTLCGDATDSLNKSNYYASFYDYRKYYYHTNCGSLPALLGLLYKGALSSSLGQTTVKKPDGTYQDFTNWTGNGIALNNGTFLFYSHGSPNCDGYGSTTIHKTLGGICIGGYITRGIFVDVNGAKPPNMWGKDFFQIQVAENGIYPTGVNPSTLVLDACDSVNYQNCGAWILANPDFKVPY